MLVFRDYDPNIGLNGLSKFPIPKLDAPSSLKSFSTSFDSHHLQFTSKIDQSSFLSDLDLAVSGAVLIYIIT